MDENTNKNTKDKLNSGPSTTGSFGISTDANITTDSAGAENEGSHDLFVNLNTDKKHN